LYLVKKISQFLSSVFAIKKPKLVDIIIAINLAFVIGTFCTAILNVLFKFYPQQEPEALRVVLENIASPDIWIKLTFLFFVCIWAPLVEELIFRGIVWWACEKLFSVNFAWFITSILFCLAHQEILHIISLIPLSIFFGYLRKKSKSIFVPMAAHAANNTLASIVTLL